VTETVHARLAGAVDILSDLDAWLEARGDRLPPLPVAKALGELDAVAAQFHRLCQSLVAADNESGTVRGWLDAPGGR
jgi:hypothetical protein